VMVRLLAFPVFGKVISSMPFSNVALAPSESTLSGSVIVRENAPLEISLR
jgi:hypothetical protein